MKIFIIRWGIEDEAEVEREWTKAGLEVTSLSLPDCEPDGGFVVLNPFVRKEMVETLQNGTWDMVFSIDYIHEVSVFCQLLGLRYVSWVVAMPNWDLYRTSIVNECNFILAGDTFLAAQLKEIGSKHVDYLAPGARIVPWKEQPELYPVSCIERTCQISPRHPLGENTLLTPSAKGYLDGLVHGQRVVYGACFLQEMILPEIVRELEEKYPLRLPEDVIMPPELLYTYLFLLPKVMYTERSILFKQTGREIHQCTDRAKRDQVIQSSGIVLNISSRFLNHGADREILYIMGSGGFVLTTYREDLFDLFVPGEDFIAFEDQEDMKLKMAMFYNEKEKRRKIRENAYEKVKSLHSFRKRAEEILEITGQKV